jgi:hypothetical protein
LKVIQLNKFIDRKLKPADPGRYHQLHSFDFRGALKNLPSQEKEEALQSKIRIIDIAYGALIALRVKQDPEAVKILADCFTQAMGKPAIVLQDIPEIARGYVWNQAPRMMAYARVLMNQVPK